MTNRKDIVKRINDAFAANDLEKVLSLCTDDLTWTMVGDTTVRGKDAIRKWMASMTPEAPRFTVQQTLADGDIVVARGDMKMRPEQGAAEVPYTFCDIYRFDGDKVAELTAFVIRTDKAGERGPKPQESGELATARHG